MIGNKVVFSIKPREGIRAAAGKGFARQLGGSFDEHVNIHWPLVHYKSAARYLQRSPEDIAATGGTNWQKYLPPRFQKRIFYPELWNDEEKENWGRAAFI